MISPTFLMVNVFFTMQHLDSFACEPLPSRTDNHSLRVSSLQQVMIYKLLRLFCSSYSWENFFSSVVYVCIFFNDAVNMKFELGRKLRLRCTHRNTVDSYVYNICQTLPPKFLVSLLVWHMAVYLVNQSSSFLSSLSSLVLFYRGHGYLSS